MAFGDARPARRPTPAIVVTRYDRINHNGTIVQGSAFFKKTCAEHSRNGRKSPVRSVDVSVVERCRWRH